jgi:hypothetical protein
LYSTVRKDTSYKNIETPGLAGKLATAKAPTAGITATAEMPARAGMKTTAEKPTTSGTPTKAENPATVRTSVCRWFRFAQLAKGKKFRP